MSREIKVRILRFTPKKDKEPRFVEYNVPIEEGESIHNVLNYIYENIDSTLAYYQSCRIGKCRGCVIRINGRTGYSCTTPAKGDVTLEPILGREIIRDLVVDLDKKI